MKREETFRARRPTRTVHEIRCPRCRVRFELFLAEWCRCPVAFPTKVCPGCRRCLCEWSGSADPRSWIDPPPGFRRRGFRKLHVRYL